MCILQSGLTFQAERFLKLLTTSYCSCGPSFDIEEMEAENDPSSPLLGGERAQSKSGRTKFCILFTTIFGVCCLVLGFIYYLFIAYFVFENNGKNPEPPLPGNLIKFSVN